MADQRAIITGTINETARGDPDALTGRIVVAVTDAAIALSRLLQGPRPARLAISRSTS
jgi:hypothetical protein